MIHDSFVESFLKQTLSPYFEDISFVQYRFIENGDIASAMAHYDQLVIERTERQIGGVVDMILNNADNADNADKDIIGIRLGLE